MSRPFEGSYLGDGSKIADDTRLECGICWWVYDPALGDDVAQVAPGTAFRLLPDTWTCPNCAADRQKFMVIGTASAAPNDAVQQFANAYRRVALKMKGMPIYNPTLAVEAVGFRRHDGRDVGVMITPWFMNLAVLPSAEDRAVWIAGGTVRLAFPSGAYDFLVSELPDVGLIGSCPLFSQMSDFTDHEAAQVAAAAAADALFQPETVEPAPTVSRRQLLGGGEERRRQPVPNRRTGNGGGGKRPSFRCQYAHDRSSKTPGGAAASASINSSSETKRRNTLTSSCVPYVSTWAIRCSGIEIASTGDLNQTTRRASSSSCGTTDRGRISGPQGQTRPGRPMVQEPAVDCPARPAARRRAAAMGLRRTTRLPDHRARCDRST